jgi:hypothetical protein
MLRVSQNIPGDSKPIVVHADQVTTWVQGTQRILLLKGMVLVEQGVVHVRTQQGVAWVDQDQARRTGILQLILYADGNVQIEKGADTQTGPKAMVELSTRGELKLRSQQNAVTQLPVHPVKYRWRLRRRPLLPRSPRPRLSQGLLCLLRRRLLSPLISRRRLRRALLPRHSPRPLRQGLPRRVRPLLDRGKPLPPPPRRRHGKSASFRGRPPRSRKR